MLPGLVTYLFAGGRHRHRWALCCLVGVLGWCSWSVAQPIKPGETPAPKPVEAQRAKKPSYVSSGTRHKVVLDKRAADYQESLSRLKIESAIDYGSFLVCEVATAAPRALLLTAGENLSLRDDYYLIRLRGVEFDVTEAPPAVPAMLLREPTPEAQLHLVQFAGPPKEEWLDELRGIAGLELVCHVPNNAQLVYATGAAREQLGRLVEQRPEFQWTGPYHPQYAIGPRVGLTAEAGEQPVTIQLFDHSGVNTSLDAIRGAASKVDRDAYRVLGFRNIEVRVPAGRIAELARLPDVVNIEYNPPNKLYDEVQDQILANALSGGGTVPIGPGYLAWLNDLGFTSNFDFAVDVTDSGVDQGSTAAANLHADFLDAGGSSRVAYAVKVSGTTIGSTATDAQDCDGHGTINCAIVGGLNDTQGDTAFEDGDGYQYGLGIAPYALIGSSRIFAPAWTDPDFTALIDNAYSNGARVSSNSWGAKFPTGSYDATSQEYDALVRDARPSSAPGGGESGNQEMVIVFAAGNAGPGATTIGDRGSTAKNTITVGATENVRATGDADGNGCAIGDGGADDARDVIGFSSRGPCADGRTKPDVVAPGTHVQGAASQAACFNGSSVCGGPTNDGALPAADAYYPAGQTLYTWSSGTSHSCPAVSGAAALLIRWFDLKGWPVPSPAMVKAFLVNSPEYLTGVSGSDTLPSNTQGLGRVNLERLFDDAARLIVDQTRRFTTTGQTYELEGVVADGLRPVRVTLTWTDAPGNPMSAAALVNDLNLSVTVGGVTYRGNVFAGANSAPGGVADTLNNVESVFLPAGATGNVQITVTANGINGDGVPNVGGALDQDFALVAYNVVAPARDPINLALVLDKSGSMSGVAAGGSEPKIDLLKKAVELFVKTWQPFSVPGDKIGVSYFSSLVETFPSSPPILQPYDAVSGSVIADVSAKTAGGYTAMGGGLQVAINELEAEADDRFVILFTDGMQNYNPKFVYEAGVIEIKDSPTAWGDSGVAGAPGVSLASRDIPVHAIGVGVNGASYESLLMDVAGQTGGLFHFTSDPDEDLELFFLNDLVASLQGATPRMARHTVGVVRQSAPADERFQVNTSATKACFVLSWDEATGGRGVGFELVSPDSSSAFPLQTERGRFYQVTAVEFPRTRPSAHSHAGQWQMKISSKSESTTGYRAYLILDDHAHDFSFWIDPKVRWAGKPIRLHAAIHRGDQPVAFEDLKILATVDFPKVAMGDLYSKHLRSVQIDPDRGADKDLDPVHARMDVLLRDKDFRKLIARDSARVALYDDGKAEHGDEIAGDGIYSGLFEESAVPGLYEVQYLASGKDRKEGPLERTAAQSLSLGSFRFDAQKSGLKVRKIKELEDRTLLYEVQMRPIDEHGHLLGPGCASLLSVRPQERGVSGEQFSDARWPTRRAGHATLTDNLDGSYTSLVPVSPTKRAVALSISLAGREIFETELPR